MPTVFLALLLLLFFLATGLPGGFIVEAGAVTFRPLRDPAAGAARAGADVDAGAAFACSSIRAECPDNEGFRWE